MRLDSKFVTETLFSDIKSLNQNTCGQVFSHKVGFSAVQTHMHSEIQLGNYILTSAMITVFQNI